MLYTKQKAQNAGEFTYFVSHAQARHFEVGRTILNCEVLCSIGR